MTAKKSPGECRFCTSKKCTTRIATKNLSFDEVACGRHIRDLELLADKALGKSNGVIRWHISSTDAQRRGEALSK